MVQPSDGVRAALREEWRRAAAFARPLDRHPAGTPEPPPLPPGRTVVVPGMGETFVRVTDAVPGALPVLLLHGWVASADLNWWRSYEPLAATRQVVAVDHQGHGRGIRAEQPFTLARCADVAAGTLRALGIERAVVCGYSMGGPIALLTWQRHRDRVAGLVLGATALEWRHRRLERLQWRLLPAVEAVLRLTTGRTTVQRVVRQSIDDDPSLEPLRGWLLGETQRGHLPDMIEAGRELSRWDARALARSVDVPVAVLHTTRDRLVRPTKQEALARATSARVHRVDGDHDAPVVCAGAFNAALLAAVEGVAERAGETVGSRPIPATGGARPTPR